MPKTVIHLFHDDPDSLATGSRVAQRVLEAAGDHGVDVEVFCFGPAQRRLGAGASEAERTFDRQLDELVAAGVRVGACVNAARAEGTEGALLARGFQLHVARDELLRFTLEGATVVTF
ncbi:DsrE family protein [Puerhibacterium sp. TATVAM-FAB25]|uniref:DsrE family protein n=1 Tax=Puerhibacterium sp. TATVAM-FAB25 TaxID=3093699 RepID=UPI00397B11E2